MSETRALSNWAADYHEALTREWREMPAEARTDIPEHLRDGLDRYVLERIETGGFLRAVLENDLRGAVSRAHSPEILLALPGLCAVLYTYAPAGSHGSPERVAAWLKGETE